MIFSYNVYNGFVEINLYTFNFNNFFVKPFAKSWKKDDGDADYPSSMLESLQL